MSSNCTQLYVLSAIACKLSECLSEEELEILSADLNALGEMLESILARQSSCQNDKASSNPQNVP